jgi:hypothetical protein
MVQTLTVWSNGIAEINTGTNFLRCDGLQFTEALHDKLDAIGSVISAAGISQLHAERDTFREFEHVVVGGTVSSGEFGTTVSAADFDWIMQHVDLELQAQKQSPTEELTEPEII